NVATNYGRRVELAKYLIDNGSPDLLSRLAGQALSSWGARGLGRLGAQIGSEIAAGLVGLGGLTAAAPGAALAPFMSPKLMGYGAYGLGRAARLGQFGPAAFQFGRAGETAETP